MSSPGIWLRAQTRFLRWCWTPPQGAAGAVACAPASAPPGDGTPAVWGVTASSTVAIPRRWLPAPLWGETSFHSVAPALRSRYPRRGALGICAVEVSATRRSPMGTGAGAQRCGPIVPYLPARPGGTGHRSVTARYSRPPSSLTVWTLWETPCPRSAQPAVPTKPILAANSSRLIATTWGRHAVSCGAPTGWCWPARTIRRRLPGGAGSPPEVGGNPKCHAEPRGCAQDLDKIVGCPAPWARMRGAWRCAAILNSGARRRPNRSHRPRWLTRW